MPKENKDYLSVQRKIKIIGAGGFGVNVVHHMIASAVLDVEYICADTDWADEPRCSGHKAIRLYRNRQPAGKKLDLCRIATELADGGFRPSIEGADTLFIIAGMGGRTGQQVAPEMAKIARSMGIVTIAIVTMPAGYETNFRQKYADVGLAELQANVDSMMVTSNEKIIEILSDEITEKELYAYGYDLVKFAIDNIIRIIAMPGNKNIGFKDLQPLWCTTVDRFNDQYGIGILEPKP